MKNILGLFLVGAAGYLLWRMIQSRGGMSAPTLRVTLLEDIPSGSQLTGRVEQTSNTQPPDGSKEIVGFALKNWAEVITPAGQTHWVEVRVQ